MVDHIVKVAQILLLPDLEDETKKAVNSYIRDGLKQPAAAAGNAPKPEDILNEWLHGPGGDTT